MNRSKLDLKTEIEKTAEKCVSCDICVKECAFLQKYGNPKHIAITYEPDTDYQKKMPFECSLCALCTAVCPVGADPAAMFLEMRKFAVSKGAADGSHNRILNYENRGTSKRYSYYGLPQDCDTIFFPGCALPGTRPKTTLKLIQLLQSHIPTLGIVLDCCTSPSHDLGYTRYFHQMFDDLCAFLIQNHVQNVLVACPNCYKIFRQHGGPLAVQTVYEYLSQHLPPRLPPHLKQTVTLHDPCPMRFEEPVLNAVRDLLANSECDIVEMPHARRKTLCCGEGGAVSLVAAQLAAHWTNTRIQETKGIPMITYCAGCAGFLARKAPTHHLLDFIFEPQKTLEGNARISTAPFTYLNRLMLKRKLKKIIPAKITRERTHRAARR